jgi:hypothetical protein
VWCNLCQKYVFKNKHFHQTENQNSLSNLSTENDTIYLQIGISRQYLQSILRNNCEMVTVETQTYEIKSNENEENISQIINPDDLFKNYIPEEISMFENGNQIENNNSINDCLIINYCKELITAFPDVDFYHLDYFSLGLYMLLLNVTDNNITDQVYDCFMKSSISSS